MAVGSSNVYPKLYLASGSAPSNPASGVVALFIDNADGHLKRKNNSGTVTDIEAGGGGGGGSGNYTLITDTVVSGSVAANIDFTSIVGTYKHLRVIGQVRSDASGVNNVMLRLRMNADSTTAHYQWQQSEFYSGNTNNGSENGSDTAISIAHATAALCPAGFAGIFTLEIPNYAATVFNKSVLSSYAYPSGAGAAGNLNGATMGHWVSTAAITELTFLPASGNFIIGSRISLYGLS